MKQVARLTFATLLALASLPAFAADGSSSFWDELWSFMTGHGSATTQAENDPAYCKAHPLECASGFQ